MLRSKIITTQPTLIMDDGHMSPKVYGSNVGCPCLIYWLMIVQMLQKASNYNNSASGRLMRPAWRFHAFTMRAAWD
ncbi:hypothetical protein HanIR_Chr01g0049391 [Helianthus annuus]|nr:hypothetical protein HanIR_Chr01g0049391 [Helianthus annuus]